MNPLPGQITVPLGSILLGEPGDVDASIRPSWAKDGSLLVFRQLQQLVPEFNSFLSNNAIQGPGLSAQQGADLLGARMVGRWQSVIHSISSYVPLVHDIIFRVHLYF